MKVSLPKRPKKTRRIKPKLLLDESIPRPLHGVNPRTIRGKVWWDRTRKYAYAYNNDHCHCCGVYKRDAEIFQWLEAHETFAIDYAKCRTRFTGVVALCHACHAVIHAGRTTNIYLDHKISRARFEKIVLHGQRHFKKYRLEKPVQFRFMELIYEGASVQEAKKTLKREYRAERPLKLSTWASWRLEFNGRLYAPKFKSHDDWRKQYGNDR